MIQTVNPKISMIFEGVPPIRMVVFCEPVTIVHWADNTKTTVVCERGEKFNKERGIVTAVAKKAMGGGYGKVLKALENSVDISDIRW